MNIDLKIERTKNATKNIIFGMLLKIYQIIIPFLMRTVMIYSLGVEYLGLNSLFVSILQVLNLVELGVGSAMVFSMYKPIANDDDKTICALMKLYKIYYQAIGLIILILGLLLCPAIPYLIKSDLPPNVNIYILYILNLLATVFSYWLFAYKNSLLQAFQRTDVISKVTIAVNTLVYILQFIFLIVFKNYYCYIILTLLGQILVNIITAFVVNRMYPQYKPIGNLDKKEIKVINKRVKDLFTAKLGGVIISSVDTIVISSFLGLKELAIYQNYYYILNAIYGVVTIIFSAVCAGIGNSFETETIDKNYNDFSKFTFLICWISTICVACFLVLYQPFMNVWVGQEYMLDNSYVILFGIYFYVLVLPMVWATIKDAVGLWHYDRFRPLIGALVNLILNIILVNIIGLYGIIISTIISYVFISMPWLLHNLFKYVYKKNIKNYLTKLVKYIFVCIVSSCIVILLCNYIKIYGIMEIIIKCIVALIIANLIQFIFYYKSEEYKDSVKLVKKMLKIGGKN